jgi:hypothetical protein
MIELQPGSPTLRATLFHAVLVGAIAILKSAANALFVARCPPSWLALNYVAVAGVVTLVTILLAGPLARRPPRRLLTASTILLAVLVGGVGAVAHTGAPVALAVLYVAAEVYATTLSVLFWTTIGGWFDARSARESFAYVSAGGMAGSMVGGVLVRALVGLIGAPGTAIVAAALPLFALALVTRVDLRSLDAGAGATFTSARAPAGVGLGAGVAQLLGRPYHRTIAAFAAISAMVAACVDFVFRVEAASRLGEHALAGLFGDLNAVVGAVAIAYQIFVTRRVLRKGGLFVFLSVVPTLLLVTSGIAAAGNVFALVVLMKGVEMAGSYSIQQSGMQLLYNPVPPEARGAVRAFVDGLVRKGGLAASGVGLAVLAEVFPRAVSPWLVAALTFASLLFLRIVRRGYLEALDEKLRGSRAAFVAPSVEVADRATRKLLVRTLESPEGADVLTALSVLERDPDFDPEPHVERLLTHTDARVRLRAIALVPENAPDRLVDRLRAIVASAKGRPRAAAVRALARAHPGEATHWLAPHLRDEDVTVACAVVAALVPLRAGRELAVERLGELMASSRSADAATRTELARLLGELPGALATPHIITFIEDVSASVRIDALRSVARIFDAARECNAPLDSVMELVRAVRARLLVRSDRDAAREALARLGNVVVPVLRRNLDERRHPLALRIEIPRLLSRIGTPAAAEALLFSNIRDHPSLRYRIAESLFRLKRRHPETPINARRADEACLRRFTAFMHYRPICHALARADLGVPLDSEGRRAWETLRRATSDRLMQNLETALHLLGLNRGPERMARVARQLIEGERVALRGGTPLEVQIVRADALEVLDVVLAGDGLHDEVLRILEPPPTLEDGPRARWHDAARTAAALRASHDPLLAALARRVLASAPSDAASGGTSDIVLAASWEAFQASDPTISDPTDYEDLRDMNEQLLTRVLALERVDLFAGLSIDDVTAIAGIAEERVAAPNEVLYREGDPSKNMMVIVRGAVRLERGTETIMRLREGESIGQVSMLDRAPRPTTAVVDDALGAELLVIDGDAFLDLLEDRPAIMRGLFVVLGRRLRILIERA